MKVESLVEKILLENHEPMDLKWFLETSFKELAKSDKFVSVDLIDRETAVSTYNCLMSFLSELERMKGL